MGPSVPDKNSRKEKGNTSRDKRLITCTVVDCDGVILKQRCNVIDRLQLLSLLMADQPNQFDKYSIRAETWTLMFGWALQYCHDTGIGSEFETKLYQEKRPHSRIKMVLGVPGLRAKMEHDAKEMVAICLLNDKNRKNRDIATDHLTKGLRHMGAGEYVQALEEFNQGLIFAPHPFSSKVDENQKQLFAMILTSRVKAFKKLKRYDEAWFDLSEAINQRISVKYLSHLISAQKELYLENGDKSKSTRLLELTIDVDCFGIKAGVRSQTLPGACKALGICYSKKHGRGIAAYRPTRKRDVIMSDEAVVSWLSPIHYDTHCAHCLKKLCDKPFPCRKCITVKFCSSKCSVKAWDSYHARECKFMDVFQFIALGHSAWRIVLMNGVEAALEAYASYLDKKANLKESEQKTFSKNLVDLLTLKTHEHVKDGSTTACVFSAAFFALFAKTVGLIDDSTVYQFGGLMFKLICILKLNAINITDDSLESANHGNYVIKSRQNIIGAALYPTSSLINHSCEPNCYVAFVGNKLLVTNNTDLKSGDEILISYLKENERRDPNRRRYLYSNYKFKCDCSLCRRKKISLLIGKGKVPKPEPRQEQFISMGGPGTGFESEPEPEPEPGISQESHQSPIRQLTIGPHADPQPGPCHRFVSILKPCPHIPAKIKKIQPKVRFDVEPEPEQDSDFELNIVESKPEQEEEEEASSKSKVKQKGKRKSNKKSKSKNKRR